MTLQVGTLELSSAPLEGLTFATVKSRALRARADITFCVPTDGGSNLPLVILLHGVYSSHWAWAVKGQAHRTLQRMIGAGEIPPMALAMPSDGLWGDGSAYIPHPGQDFEKWIVDEVPAAAAAAHPRVTEKSPLFLAGLSMGGFGALRIGAKYPARYRAISGHSSITHLQELKKYVKETLASFGARAGDQSVLDTMERNREKLPKIRFDCGLQDPLLGANRELHLRLTELGIAHVYEEFPGGHDWEYWTARLPETLKFFGQALRADGGK
jgi:S-formylglutathione hydrolase FrmB